MNPEPGGGQVADEAFLALFTAHLDRRAARPQDAPDEPAPAGKPSPADGAADERHPLIFEAVTDELRTVATWTGPPASLKDAILASVRTHAATEGSAAADAVPDAVPDAIARDGAATPVVGGDGAVPESPRASARWWHPARWSRPRWRPQWGRRAWAVPAAVFGAALFTVGVLAVDRALAPDPPRPDTFAATGTGLAPKATAKVSVLDTPAGVDITIEPTALPAAAPGSYYAAWLSGPRGSVPIGSFHWRRTGVPIELWSGVTVEEYPTLVITLQAEGELPIRSALVVMTASLTR